MTVATAEPQAMPGHAETRPMNGLAVLLRKELLEQWRTMKLPIVAAVFLLVGLTAPLLARFTPEIIDAVGAGQFQIVLPTPTSADAIDQLIKNLGQFGALTAVLLAMGSVATEKERGTAALILSKPASRGAFLVAKLVAIGLTLAIATTLAFAGAWFYTLVLFEALSPTAFAASAAVLWLMLMSFAAITFLGSTLTRSALAAAGLGIAAFVVLGILSILPNVGQYLPTALGTVAGGLALGGQVDWLGPIVATCALIITLVVIAWLAFRRQEL